jgi:hypothetical protein
MYICICNNSNINNNNINNNNNNNIITIHTCSSYTGRFMESTWAVHRDLRGCMRSLEKLLTMSEAYNSMSADTMSMIERGRLMSVLYRLQNLLVTHSSRFEDVSLRLLQVMLRRVGVDLSVMHYCYF